MHINKKTKTNITLNKKQLNTKTKSHIQKKKFKIIFYFSVIKLKYFCNKYFKKD